MSLRGYRVLVVEDEYFLAQDMAQALEASGAQVIGPLPGLEEALAQVKRDHFELAVLDIALQGGKAYPVADALRQAGIPFIFATGYGEAAIPSRYNEVPRIEKPYEGLAITRALEALISADGDGAALSP